MQTNHLQIHVSSGRKNIEPETGLQKEAYELEIDGVGMNSI